MIKAIFQKSDTFGILASVLCIIHCIATPIIFIAHSTTINSREMTPSWWSSLDYIFLLISFLAVARSARNTSKNFMKIALWISWIGLFLVIINEKLHWISLPETVTYAFAFGLAVLHIYNLKYCQCKTEECCSYKE